MSELDRPYASKTFAEVVDDYVLVRGDLCESYARGQLAREHELRLVDAVTDYAEAGADATERMIDAEAKVELVRALVDSAEAQEAASLSRTFDGGTFGAWISAADLRAALDTDNQGDTA